MACEVKKEFFFAVRKDTGQAVNILELDKEKEGGQDCNCVCAACGGGALVAKINGTKRRPHFAHKFKTENCSANWANESGLHKMAKQIIARSNSIVVPEIWLDGKMDPNCNENDQRQISKHKVRECMRFRYNATELEIQMGDFVPDICVTNGRINLYIEIAVTHFVDEEKEAKIRRAKISTIEINISEFLDDKIFSKDKLADTILNGTKNKKWIYNNCPRGAFESLCERNKKFEVEYQENLKRENERLKREEEKEIRREKFIEERKEHQKRTEEEMMRFERDEEYYLDARNVLINPREALKRINSRRICGLNLKKIEDLPIFFNIPVFGEVAFNCDRRIWQSILFENYFLKKQNQGKINVARIYAYFVGKKEEMLNLNYVHIWKRQNGTIRFPEYNDDILKEAIKEYLQHLSLLGLMEKEYYKNPQVTVDYFATTHNMVPPNKRYANFLMEALPQMPSTNKPFEYLKSKYNKWPNKI